MTTPLIRLAAVPFVLLLAALPASAGDVLTPELLVDLRTVSNVTLDPGGERAAYLLEVPRAAGEEPGRAWRELWVADLARGTTRRYTKGKERVGAPAFSPDGSSLAFLVERREVAPRAQIYALRVRGGEARALTRHPSSVEQFSFAPGGALVAFTADDPESEAEREGKKRGRDARVADAEAKYRRLWLLDLKTKETRRLFDADLHVWDFLWTPDGRQLVLRAAPTPRKDDDYMFTRLYAAGVDGGAPRRILETPGKLGALAVAPDGRRLAYLGAVSQNDPLAQSLFVVPLAEGAAPTNLTAGHEGSGVQLAWRDAETVLMVAVEGSRQALYLVDAESGRRRRLAWPSLVIESFDVRGDRLVAAAHAASHPAELYVARADASEPRRIHDHNPRLGAVRLARQEVIEWPGGGGGPIAGVLTYPLDYEQGRRYPLVLQIHGGPEGVSLDGWTSSPTYPVQLLARDGFMVLEPNYRGSQGRGVDFAKADHDDLGGAEYADVLGGVDALVARGLVEAARVGTGGWSYGGYFSAWGATRHSARFAAAVVGAGISNWISFTGTTDIPYEMSLVHWNSWWFDEPALHWERSPLAHLEGARTPTLILHGEKDERVHPAQGLELYTALRIRGVPARFVTYPREPHGLRERAHQLDAIERVLGWFGEHLGR